MLRPGRIRSGKENMMNRQIVIPLYQLFLLTSILLLAVILFWWPRVGSAQPGAEVGRYQISSWASYSGERVHHSGYYIIDTTTGKVVERGHEIHGIDKGSKR